MRSRQSIVCRRTAHVIRFHRTQVSGLENVHESIRTIITLGTPGAEDVNREDLQVFDTVSGESCFDWRRNFPACSNLTVWRIRGNRIGKHALDLSGSDGLSVRTVR
jgi:hypothetical protein